MELCLRLALVCVSFALTHMATAQDKSTTTVAAAKPTAKPTGSARTRSAQPRLAVASPEQQMAASLVLFGPYRCEFKQTVRVIRHRVEGYAVVAFRRKHYTMKPVRSNTGAVRLEQVGNGPMLMLQIPTKSMLLDTRRGRRILDACVHAEQAKEVSESNGLGLKIDGQGNTDSSTSVPKD
jgi:hypothetical protein